MWKKLQELPNADDTRGAASWVVGVQGINAARLSELCSIEIRQHVVDLII